VRKIDSPTCWFTLQSLLLVLSAALCVLVLFSFSIFFSYALQFYVLMDIVQRNFIYTRVPPDKPGKRLAIEYAARIGLNVITCEQTTPVKRP